MGQINFGPLNIPLSLIFILLSALSGVGAITVIYRKNKDLRIIFLDFLSTAVLIILGIWKLFPLVYNPGLVLEPLSLLYTPGGLPGIIAGTAAGILYLTVKIFNTGQNSRKSLLKAALIFTAVFGISGSAMVLLHNGFGETPEQKAAYSFSASDTDNKRITLDDYKGKTLIINFWATWCPPCRGELPVLKTFAKELDNNKTVLIGINSASTEKSEKTVITFINENKINFPVILDKDGSIAAGYGVRTLPTTIVISPEGFILSRKTGTVDPFWLKSKLSDKNRMFK